jgi:signal transduction histidine kinase
VSTQTNGADPLLIRANKLDLLERVANDLAHEIKNPLHSMVINLEVLKRRISRAEAAGSSDMLRYADVLGSELDRVSQRVDLLLRMVRPGRASDSASLHEILDETRELVEVEAARRSVELRFSQTSLGGRVTAPREAARQVILNLVVTILDLLQPGDLLHIDAGRDAQGTFVSVSGPASTGTTTTDASLEPAIASADAVYEGPSYTIARLLGESLGGRVEANTSNGLSLTFSLPFPR